MKIRTLFTALAALAVLTLFPRHAHAHCEIPCGIYDDSLRFVLIAEDITTIEKSMDEINAISAAADKNYNQLVRWITNKDAHADKLIDVVTQYFLTQRITPVEPTDTAAFSMYQKKLTLCHQMIVYSMKCKQTTDRANTEKLRDLLKNFSELYWQEHGHHH